MAALALRCLVLSSVSYEVLTAADGAAALELFRSIRSDLVITDYWLPGLTGTQVAAEMKRLKPVIPTVLFNGLVEAPLGSDHADLVITKGMPAVEFPPGSWQIASLIRESACHGTKVPANDLPVSIRQPQCRRRCDNRRLVGHVSLG